ncbi:unnamed protein product [Adineta steineri]|uniref:Uncharacterized protein n=1 Tax=Adineta steineri TaxID=433720 RepID=A0A813SN24_9BILA|nr:unnamed protein product [Adineta steineri]
MLLAAAAKTVSVDSHVVVSNGKSLTGTVVVKNTDTHSMTNSKDAVCKSLQDKVQAADKNNAASQVKVNEVRDLGDGTFAIDYECTHSNNQDAAKTALNTAVKHDDVKTIINNPPKTVAANTPEPKKAATNPPQKPTAPPTEKPTAPHTEKPTAPHTEKPTPAHTEKPTPAHTEKPTPAHTDKPTAAAAKTSPPKVVKSGATKKPAVTVRKVQVKNCDDDDNIHAPDTQTLTGKIIVQDCPCEKRFSNNATRLAAITSTVCTQLKTYFQEMNHDKTNYACSLQVLTGNSTHTVFQYTVKVPQADHAKAKIALKKTCQDDRVKAAIEKESIKREDDEDDDSSSEEHHHSTGKPVVTEKAAAPQTQKPTEKPTPAHTEKATAAPTAAKTSPPKVVKSGATKKPAVTVRKVQVKNCDDDDNIHAPDTQTLTGKIIVQDCPCEKRFSNNATRLAAITSTVCTQLKTYFQEMNHDKTNYACSLQVLTGNSTHTVFQYTVKVPQADHAKAKIALKKTCQDDRVKAAIEKESIKREDDEDDDSSSEEHHHSTGKPVVTEKAAAPQTQKPTEKPAAPHVTQKDTPAPTAAHATSKATTKSGKTLKPSKPTAVDCDKDHQVTVKDDKTVTGVLRVKGCHATRFARKPTRCGSVGDKLSSLVNGRLKKVGVNVAHNVQIVKTAGDKKQTEFHYTIPCQKEHQKALLDSLKDSCKDKELTDTCTHANQPEDDDSSSESSEETTKAAPAKVTQKDVPAPTAAHATPKATSKE